MTRAQRRKLVGRLTAVVGSRHWFWVLPLIGVGLLAPGLGSGWIADDHFHGAALTADPDLPLQHRSPARLFVFVDGDPAEVWRLIDAGILPWWSDPELRLSFYRPLAGLTHALDYRLWPDSPFWAHLHSVFWYVCLIVPLLALYRRILPTAAVAGLAALLYAIDDNLTFPVLWIANRNAVISVFFGVVTLLVYDRWRRGGWKPGAVLAPLTLLGAVLANEGGVALGGYLVAYALFLDPAPPRHRIVAFSRVSAWASCGSLLTTSPGSVPTAQPCTLTPGPTRSASSGSWWSVGPYCSGASGRGLPPICTSCSRLGGNGRCGGWPSPWLSSCSRRCSRSSVGTPRRGSWRSAWSWRSSPQRRPFRRAGYCCSLASAPVASWRFCSRAC